MKNLFLIKILFILFISCKSQAQILPLNEFSTFLQQGKGLRNEGINYVKDVTGILTPYLGDWEGTKGDKKYKIRVYRFTKEFRNIKEDVIRLRYKVSNTSTGQEIINTMSLPENDKLIVRGYNLYIDNSAYKLLYSGAQRNCGQRGEFHLRVQPNSNQMSLTFTLGEVIPPNGPNECNSFSQVFPVSPEVITFNKLP